MKSNHRTAQSGDLFLLLTPTAQELQRVQQYQLNLQDIYGGHRIDHIHITCQRFSLENGLSTKYIVDYLQKEISKFTTFPIFADKVIQFHAPFWQSQMLRWRIQNTNAWVEFQYQLRTLLNEMNCPSHYERIRRATCTALMLDSKVSVEQEDIHTKYPFYLFQACQVMISRVRPNSFEYIGKIEFGNSSFNPV